jgi:hypothetical protein
MTARITQICIIVHGKLKFEVKSESPTRCIFGGRRKRRKKL